MLTAWISNTTDYSQQQHLAQLKSLYIDTQTEIRKMIRDYGYQNNSYLRKDET